MAEERGLEMAEFRGRKKEEGTYCSRKQYREWEIFKNMRSTTIHSG